MKILDIGCGLNPYPHSYRIDIYNYPKQIDEVQDILKPRLASNASKYIHFVHVLEYLTYNDATKAIKIIWSLLERYGNCRIITHDISRYSPVVSEKNMYYDNIFTATCGKQKHKYDVIKSVYTQESFITLLEDTVPGKDNFRLVENDYYASPGDLCAVITKNKI